MAENGEWRPIPIHNSDFEEGEPGESPPGWYAASPGYRFQLTAENPHAGAQAVLIEDTPLTLTEPLFSAHPAAAR